MFAHHGKIVVRVVELEDALIIVFALVFWKQVDAGI